MPFWTKKTPKTPPGWVTFVAQDGRTFSLPPADLYNPMPSAPPVFIPANSGQHTHQHRYNENRKDASFAPLTDRMNLAQPLLPDDRLVEARRVSLTCEETHRVPTAELVDDDDSAFMTPYTVTSDTDEGETTKAELAARAQEVDPRTQLPKGIILPFDDPKPPVPVRGKPHNFFYPSSLINSSSSKKQHESFDATPSSHFAPPRSMASEWSQRQVSHTSSYAPPSVSLSSEDVYVALRSD
eukprot:GILJ01005300.1.p1 GENE.GILJ01005300.1~~GILJ01005300.1.p1  ORF type:complete len:240 (-),score=24.20 GILJ01005300.1:178-897(-)